MIDYRKNPMKHIDARLAWWQLFSEDILKTASQLEDELSVTFRDDRYNEVPDPDAPLVRHFVNCLYDIYNSAKDHQMFIENACRQNERFCAYWLHGRGEWNGLQAFLQEEVNRND